MRGKWIKTHGYPSDTLPSVREKYEKLILQYHRGEISRAEFEYKMDILDGKPIGLEKYFGQKKEEK